MTILKVQILEIIVSKNTSAGQSSTVFAKVLEGDVGRGFILKSMKTGSVWRIYSLAFDSVEDHELQTRTLVLESLDDGVALVEDEIMQTQ